MPFSESSVALLFKGSVRTVRTPTNFNINLSNKQLNHLPLSMGAGIVVAVVIGGGLCGGLYSATEALPRHS